MLLHWSCKTEEGSLAEGRENWDGGALHVTAALPAGDTAQDAAAQLCLTIAENERVFMNGYQTWTYCRELPLNGRIRGLNGLPKALINRFSFDRYGDYHFVKYPYRRGRHHGETWCCFRSGDKCRLFASLDERPGYTLFDFDAETRMLSIRRDCAGVRIAGETRVFDLFYAEGTENEVFDAWFGAMNVKPRTTEKLAGYTSWYNRYQNISEETILRDLEGCSSLLMPNDLFQIDDGWERFVGDWLETDEKKFPNGLAGICEKVHAAGFRAGLWLAPFVCQKGSSIEREHPDWLLQVDGKAWSCGCNWGGFYSLDIDHPGVREYLKKVFDKVLYEWGFDLVKLDFLYGAAPFGNERESRAGRMIRAMEWLRELCGEKLILGCGVPVGTCFGLVEYCRVSCDVSLDWDDKWFMRRMHRERTSTRQALITSVSRRQLNGRAYMSDPDVFFLRSSNIRLSGEQKECLAAVNAAIGGVLMISDDPGELTEAQREMYRRIRGIAEKARDLRVETDKDVTVRFTCEGRQYSYTIQ